MTGFNSLLQVSVLFDIWKQRELRHSGGKMDASSWRGAGKMVTRGLPVMAGMGASDPQQHLWWPWRARDSMLPEESPNLSPVPLKDPTCSWWLLFSVRHEIKQPSLVLEDSISTHRTIHLNTARISTKSQTPAFSWDVPRKDPCGTSVHLRALMCKPH